MPADRTMTAQTRGPLTLYQLILVFSDATCDFHEGRYYNLISAVIDTLHNIQEGHTTEDIVEIQVPSKSFDDENQILQFKR